MTIPQGSEQFVRARPRYWAALIVSIHLGLLVDVAAEHSATFDEVVYAPAGYSYWTEGIPRLNLNPGHPPILKYWLALPLLGDDIDARSVDGWNEDFEESKFGFNFIYRQGGDPWWIILRARVMNALLSAMLAAAIFVLVSRLVGSLAGLFALSLYAFDPLILGHASLATLDVGSTALLFFAAVFLPSALERGGIHRVVLAGVLVGAAVGSKYASLVLLPVLGVLIWNVVSGASEGRVAAAWRRVGGRGLVILGVAAGLIILSCQKYGLITWKYGLMLQLTHVSTGDPSFAMGERGSGWMWYLPVAWLIKTPIPVLVATPVGVFFLVRRLFTDSDPLYRALFITPVLCAGGYMVSSLSLGVRYWIPAIPFLAVAAGLAYPWFTKRRIGRVAVLVGLAWLIVGSLRAHPNEMAYANEVSGGPERLWEKLADSNVDWGQSLPALAREVERFPLRRLYLSYFGTADPTAYGLRYTALPPSWYVPDMQWYTDAGMDPNGREWIAMSTNHLIGLYSGRRRRAWEWLRNRPMSALPGFSIALFDITGDTASHIALGETVLSFGRPELALLPLRRALELDPKNPYALRVLGEANAALEAAEH